MESNGVMKENILQIKKDVHEMKDDFASVINGLKISVENLSGSVDRLGDKWDIFSNSMLNSVPIKAVFFMFLILVLALVGVEGAQFLFKEFLPKIM